MTAFITPVFEGGSQGCADSVHAVLPTTVVVGNQRANDGRGSRWRHRGAWADLKTLSEGRNEFGPPVLSQLPYINRLFRNIGIGRETRHIMIMVTPRIIIQSEEEFNQTGLDPSGVYGQ